MWLIPSILATLTGIPRVKIPIRWSRTSLVHNLFRLKDLIFWRRFNDIIRLESIATPRYVKNITPEQKLKVIEAGILSYFSNWLHWLELYLSYHFHFPVVFGVISFVNHGEWQDLSGTALTSVSTTSFNATAGNLISVAVYQTDTNNPSSVTDTATNTYTRIAATNSAIGTTANITNWYAKNISGNANNVVTANFSPAVAFDDIIARQYSGCNTTSPVDATATGNNTANVTSITSGTFTTTSANEVIIAFVGLGTQTTMSVGSIGGTTATNLVTDNNVSGQEDAASEDQIVSSIQTNITASMSWTTATYCGISVVSFKAAATGAFTKSLFVPQAINRAATY